MTHTLTFDAVAEDRPGAKWRARWTAGWPAYRAWFARRALSAPGGAVPSRAACEAALARHMPELAPTHRRLTALAGGGDDAARFLSAWCPPAYLGGCSLAALSRGGETRLLRNYDLSPDLNEGLLLRTAWVKPVIGMVEFLWGVSDGINADGLSVALAFGGSDRTGEGFGICLILRYVLETCADVPAALETLARIPSHMDYNVALADASGRTAAIELHAGGGLTRRETPIATNHQLDAPLPDKAAFTRTVQRRAALSSLAAGTAPAEAAARFLAAPLFQRNYDGGFGTLFTAEYDPPRRAMRLLWEGAEMRQSIDAFEERSLTVAYGADAPAAAPTLADLAASVPAGNRAEAEAWLAAAEAGRPDWVRFGLLFLPRAA